jgi:hypothetical protein
LLNLFHFIVFYFIHIFKAKKSTQIKNAVFIPSCRQIKNFFFFGNPSAGCLEWTVKVLGSEMCLEVS